MAVSVKKNVTARRCPGAYSREEAKIQSTCTEGDRRRHRFKRTTTTTTTTIRLKRRTRCNSSKARYACQH